MFVLYIFILSATLWALLNIYKSRLIFPENPSNSTDEAKESTNPRNNTNFESANIVTCSRDDNTCVAIFKNPLDRKTHFYRTRLRGNLCDSGCPIQFRNIAATLRLWGSSMENISSLRICELNCECFEVSSKWVSRLDDQKNDCQTKFGCRIDFTDFAILKATDKNNLHNLSQKIMENCISEDDLEYFKLQDDTYLVQKSFFDL